MIFNPFKNLPASQDFHSSPAIRRYEGNPMNVCNCSFSTLWEKLSLESNNIWATALLMLEPAIQQKAAELCPWET